MHAITAAILTIAAIIAAVAVSSTIIPELGKTSSAIVVSNSTAVERIRSGLDIVYVTGDTATNQVLIWINNTGTTTLEDVEGADLILDKPSGADRIPHGSGTEYWTYVFEDGEASWTPTTTVKITINLTSLAAGFYKTKIGMPNGASASSEFSV